MENEKMITVISGTNFTLFAGLTQKDLSSKNPTERNRLNIRPTWSHGLDEKGRIQRFDFVAGENQCPEYITEWDSFIKLANSGVLSMKGSFAPKEKDTGISLAELKAKDDEIAKLKKQLEEAKKTEAKTENKPKIEQA